MNLRHFSVFCHSATVQQHRLHPTGIVGGGGSSDNAKKAVEPVLSKTCAPIGLDYFQLREHSLQMSIGHWKTKEKLN